MRKVLKYQLNIGESHIAMRMDSIILHIESQTDTTDINMPVDRPCMWVDSDDELPYETRRFMVRGTGHPVAPDERYVGTFLLPQSVGSFVGHVFEVV